MTGYARGEADYAPDRFRREPRAATLAPKDYSVPLHVDCSIEYELPDCAKPPQGVEIEPLLMIHPSHFRRLESLRRVPFVNNLPRASGPTRARSRRCCRPAAAAPAPAPAAAPAQARRALAEPAPRLAALPAPAAPEPEAEGATTEPRHRKHPYLLDCELRYERYERFDRFDRFERAPRQLPVYL